MGMNAPRSRWFQFTIRELLLILAAASIACGWWRERHRNLTDEALLQPIVDSIEAIRGGINDGDACWGHNDEVDIHWELSRREPPEDSPGAPAATQAERP